MSTELARTDGTTSGSRLDRPRLTRELAAQVTSAEQALHRTVGEDAELRANLKADHGRATAVRRTGATWSSWLDEQVTLSAVAWVLGTVFVRWCEDNGLVEPRLSGPGERLRDAQDTQQQYVGAHPLSTSTDWLRAAFAVLADSDAGAMLFDTRHNPAERIPLSNDGARALIAYWRTTGADGRVVHDFTDPSWDTHFLGDLYQDLSGSARERYALLQTPVFVEDFILSLTLDPAMAEFGLSGLRVIDPTCGSGHFLLGAFDRLVAAWREQAPALDPTTLARRALDSVHGVDINPFAVAIARFRMLLAAWRVAGVSTLAEAAGQSWRMAIAVGDSLLSHEKRDQSFADLDQELGIDQPWEDIGDFADERLLEEGSYDVVVGNPPYITASDPTSNQLYRRLYPDVCKGTFALTVPFAHRFVDLARPGSGYIGKIASNSFMKREFGVPLVEHFFPKFELTHVIDTSGAYIPGHGTPTAIIVIRNRKPDLRPVRAVLGTRGEPSQPTDPSKGLVWSAILEQVHVADSTSRWVDGVDLDRTVLAEHPWSLAGGGAYPLTLELQDDRERVGGIAGGPIGGAVRVGADEAYLRPIGSSDVQAKLPVVRGDGVRDWSAALDEDMLSPYAARSDEERDALTNDLWRWRTSLAARRTFSGSMADAGLRWFDYMQYTKGTYLLHVMRL